MTDSNVPYKPAFGRIDEEKRLRVLDTATRVFAEKGFVGANINAISEEAGISIGAMYNYFETKQDLFLTVIDHLHDVLEKGLIATVDESMGFFQAVEAIMRAAVDAAMTQRDKTVLYLKTTSEPIEGLSTRLTEKMEGVTVTFYREMVTRAVESGELPDDVDVRMLGFFIDNQIVALQRAYASVYHQERLNLFLDGHTLVDEVVQRVMAMLKAAAGIGR